MVECLVEVQTLKTVVTVTELITPTTTTKPINESLRTPHPADHGISVIMSEHLDEVQSLETTAVVTELYVSAHS